MTLIRPYQPRDAEQVARVFFESVHGLGLGPYSQAQLNAWAPTVPSPQSINDRSADGRTFLVAVDTHDVPLAYGDLKIDGHIDHLYCHPSAARRGLGTALYMHLENTARERRMRSLFVEASEVARPLFEQFGYTLVDRHAFELRGVPIHNDRMRKSLAP